MCLVLYLKKIILLNNLYIVLLNSSFFWFFHLVCQSLTCLGPILIQETGLNGAVAKLLVNGLVGKGSQLVISSYPVWVFKSPMCKCNATTPFSFLLTSTKNQLTVLDSPDIRGWC